jgi:hypothetical protein
MRLGYYVLDRRAVALGAAGFALPSVMGAYVYRHITLSGKFFGVFIS